MFSDILMYVYKRLVVFFLSVTLYLFIGTKQLCFASEEYSDAIVSEKIKILGNESSIKENSLNSKLSENKKSSKQGQGYHWTFSSDSFPGWENIDEGLQLGRFIGVSNSNNEFEFVIIRIDPYYYDFSLHMSSQTGRAFSLYDWSRKHNLDVAINASMYLPDGFTSTGYLRSADHINNGHIASRFGAFFVADPYNVQLPNADLLDRNTDNWEEILPQYRVVVQNYRIISSDRNLLWRSKNIAHSIAAVARDGKGHLLFIHTRYPMSDADFGKLLLELPIDVRVVMYVEGGSQAGLFLRSPSFTQLWIGKHPVDILDIDHSSPLLPNIIGARKKNSRFTSNTN